MISLVSLLFIGVANAACSKVSFEGKEYDMSQMTMASGFYSSSTPGIGDFDFNFCKAIDTTLLNCGGAVPTDTTMVYNDPPLCKPLASLSSEPKPSKCKSCGDGGVSLTYISDEVCSSINGNWSLRVDLACGDDLPPSSDWTITGSGLPSSYDGCEMWVAMKCLPPKPPPQCAKETGYYCKHSSETAAYFMCPQGLGAFCPAGTLCYQEDGTVKANNPNKPETPKNFNNPNNRGSAPFVNCLPPFVCNATSGPGTYCYPDLYSDPAGILACPFNTNQPCKPSTVCNQTRANQASCIPKPDGTKHS